jgi:hypothetical protein
MFVSGLDTLERKSEGMATAACLNYGAPATLNLQQKQQGLRKNCLIDITMMGKRNIKTIGLKGGYIKAKRRIGMVRCNGRGIGDFIGGDLLKFDLGRWLSDVEEHKAIAIYTPHEGGYEGRYLNRLRYQGYYFLDLSARGLGDPETTLTKIHPVCPVSSLCSQSLTISIQFLSISFLSS